MKNAHANPLAGAAAGAIGGLVASWVMIQFNHVLGMNGVPEEERRRPHAHRRVRALPNESDATIADEPGSRAVASGVAEAVTGRPLTESEKDIGGPIAHYLFGACVGAVYGAAAEVKPDTTTGFGLPFGATVWVTADEIGMPLLGVSEPPTDLPWSRHASSFGSHLVYGLVVEGVRRAIRGSHASRRDTPWWEG